MSDPGCWHGHDWWPVSGAHQQCSMCHQTRVIAASDGATCMIFKKSPRVVANACLGCSLSLIACQAGRELQAEACCETCSHD